MCLFFGWAYDLHWIGIYYLFNDLLEDVKGLHELYARRVYGVGGESLHVCALQ